MRKTHRIAAILASFLLVAPAAATPVGGFFAVIVDDLDSAVAWYSAVLGLQAREPIGDGENYEIVNLARPGLFVELLELKAAVKRPEDTMTGPFKVGFLVEDLDRFIAALPDEVPRPQVVADEKNELVLIQLRDPDGNIIQVMEIAGSGRTSSAPMSPGTP